MQSMLPIRQVRDRAPNGLKGGQDDFHSAKEEGEEKNSCISIEEDHRV